MKEIKLVENTSELGAGTRGASLGIGALQVVARQRKEDFFGQYERFFVGERNDMLDFPTIYSHAKRIDGLAEVFQNTVDILDHVFQNNDFPIVLSGDHSCAAGTISGIKKAHPHKRLGVIWIDAHADLHTPYTTPSGNVHGMPLAVALGVDNLESKRNDPKPEVVEMWEELKNIGLNAPKLRKEDLVFISVRDTEKPEEDYFYTYYKDKLTPQFVASLEKEGVEITQGFETILDNYFQRGELDRIGKSGVVTYKDIVDDKKAGKIKNFNPEEILTAYYSTTMSVNEKKKAGNLDTYLNKNLDNFTKAWNNIYDPNEDGVFKSLKNLPNHKKEVNHNILISELEKAAENKNPDLRKVESVAQLLSKQELRLEQKRLDELTKETKKINDHRMLLHKIELDDLVEKGQEDGVTGIELIGDAYVVSAKDEKTRKKYQEKLDGITLNYYTEQKEAVKTFEDIKNGYAKLQLNSEDVYSKDLLQGALAELESDHFVETGGKLS